MLRIAALFTILGLAFGAAVQQAQQVPDLLLPDVVTVDTPPSTTPAPSAAPTTMDTVVVEETVCESWTTCDAACGGGSRSCSRSDGKTWNIECHVQDCAAIDACGNADVVFVLDSSASLGEKNWYKAKQFVIDVSKGLKISPDESRVGLVIYSNKGQKVFGLTDFTSIDTLEAAVWPVEHMAGNTNTYEGLLYAQEILEKDGREGMKHIVVVITDGKSNNKADLVKPTAEAMHKKGVEIFALGITSDVDQDEINTIASAPVADHARYVVDYDALRAITNEIISDTCEAANRVECGAWIEWSVCEAVDQVTACGAGVKSRKRECKFYTSINDPNPETATQTQYMPCDISCDPCSRCEYQANGLGYAPSANCHGFIMCVYNNGNYIKHELSCGHLVWDQATLTCVGEHQIDLQHCSLLPIGEQPEVTTPEFVCDKVANALYVGRYIWNTNIGTFDMPCAAGTIFDEVSCQCVHGDGNAPTECNRDTLLEFPFNENTNDICNRATGVAIGPVVLENGAAYFDGTSRVEIGYLNNWFANNPTTHLTVTLWFKLDAGVSGRRGLFTNGDCVDDASVLMELVDNHAEAQIITDTQRRAVFDNVADKMEVLSDEWVFATLVYTGDGVKYYINGDEKAVMWSIDGPIANTQCAANIGFSAKGNGLNYFQGYIDDVRVYKKTLWDFDIKQLYQAGRQ